MHITKEVSGLCGSNAFSFPEDQEMIGRKITTDPKIGIKHFIVMQADGLINEIYLVLTPNKFLSIN